MALIEAFFATLAFSLLFQLRGWALLPAAGGGALGWGAYLLAVWLGSPPVLADFVGAAAVTLFSELISRLGHRPAVAFLLPGLIPLVPGSQIYTTMELAVNRKFSESLDAGFQALAIAVAVVMGVVTITALAKTLGDRGQRRRKSDGRPSLETNFQEPIE